MRKLALTRAPDLKRHMSGKFSSVQIAYQVIGTFMYVCANMQFKNFVPRSIKQAQRRDTLI